MIKGGHGQTNQLHDINWGALDHASRASQLMSCNYYVHTHMSIKYIYYVYIYMHTCTYYVAHLSTYSHMYARTHTHKPLQALQHCAVGD